MRLARLHAGLLAAVLAGAVFATAPPCYAGNEAAAETLFAEGKKLVLQKKYAEACEKFKESNRLDRGAGTLIHLADCYEKNKQLSTAWATFLEAASAAQAIKRADWQKRATERAKKLEPKLAKVTIKVPDPVPDIVVKRDDAILSETSWANALPLDVGDHTIEVSAPGFQSYKTTFKVAKDGEVSEIVIPKLVALPPAVAEKTPTTTTTKPTGPAADPWAQPRPGQTQRTIGLVVGGVGILGVGVGAVTGVLAMTKDADSKRECPQDGACTSGSAIDANDSAKTLGLVSTIGFIAGGALVATGVVLYLTAPKGGEQKVGKIQILPSAGPNSAGLLLGGTF